MAAKAGGETVRKVRIFQPSKTAMQSGRANSKAWMLRFESRAPKVTDPLMGWTGSADTGTQLRLRFASREDAIAYAERNGFAYTVDEPQARRVRPKSYAENFRS